MEFEFASIASPIGEITLVWDDAERLRSLEFEGHEERKRRLLRRQYGEISLRPGVLPASHAAALNAYFSGALDALASIPCATNGTPFQETVWSLLRTIGPGETMSYGALAARAGNPNASRAVGLANGSNPVALVVPCHRVIGADGTLTGFGGGIDRKRWLLQHEAAHAGQGELFALN